MPLPNQEIEPSLVLDNKLLEEKNVLVTGAGKNIGKSIALEMAKQGANIYFTDIDQGRCAELEQELADYPVKSRGFLSDISKNEAIDILFNSLPQDGVKIDILINNVGILIEKPSIKRF